jgi:hypothetical protein
MIDPTQHHYFLSPEDKLYLKSEHAQMGIGQIEVPAFYFGIFTYIFRSRCC